MGARVGLFVGGVGLFVGESGVVCDDSTRARAYMHRTESFSTTIPPTYTHSYPPHEPFPHTPRTPPHTPTRSGKGGQAWYTPFRCYVPTFLDEPVTLLTSYSCALQLPLDGVIAEGGGLSFVLKRPSGSKPEWLRNATQRDFYLSCKPVGVWVGGCVLGCVSVWVCVWVCEWVCCWSVQCALVTHGINTMYISTWCNA